MKMIIWSAFAALMIAQPFSVFCQNTTWWIDAGNSKVVVSGTSTLKDWSAQTSAVTGSMTLDSTGQIKAVDLSFDSNSLDGGRGADMNSKIEKALKSDEYPQIRFHSDQVQPGGSSTFSSTGKVMIAGVEKEITVAVERNLNNFAATKDLKLSDFSIKPPTAMFGQIVCHDDITLSFELAFKETAQ